MAPEECPIDCSTKVILAKMQPQMDEVHSYIMTERATKEALEKAAENRRKNTTMYVALITLVILLIGGLWEAFRIVG